MRVIIGTVDGHVHESADFTWEEIQEALPGNGYAGVSKKNKALYVNSMEDFLEMFQDFLKYDTSMDTQTLNMQMRTGRERNFNVRHIVWWEIVHD